MSDEGSPGAFFVVCCDHPSAMMHACVNNFHRGNTLWGTWEREGKGQFGKSEGKRKRAQGQFSKSVALLD